MTSGSPDYVPRIITVSPTLNVEIPVITSLTHFNGTISTTADTITWTGATAAIYIENTHASNSLLVSFDSGSTWKTILSGALLSIECNLNTFQIKGSAAGTTYEILVGKG